MTTTSDPSTTTARRARLLIEFAAFYIGLPVLIAVVFPPDVMFTMLFASTGFGLLLLHLTPGFRWRSLADGAGRIGWTFVAVFSALTLLTGYVAVTLTAPEARFFLLRENPGLMLMIALLYPFLSALPQEVVFRPLFFRRYGALLPGGEWPPIVLNAAIFAFAHLMYWSWLVTAMSFAGGLAFAYAYERRGNFAEAVVLHAFAGIIVFALGLGIFFYSGNVTRPF